MAPFAPRAKAASRRNTTGANPDGYALAIGNRRGALQRIVGNVEGEDIGFGLTGYVALHDTDPIEALTGEPN